MHAQARCVLPSAIAALAVSVSVFVISPPNSAANAAETCLAAPEGAAPQGSQWRYRLERGTQRKCWRVVQMDQTGQRAATQTDPQGDADIYTEEPAAPQTAKKPVARVAAPQPKTRPALVTKDASDTKNTSNATTANRPVQWPNPPASMMQRLDTPAAPPPPDQGQNNAPTPAALAQQPGQQPAAEADSAATIPLAGGTFTLRSVLAAIALLGFAVCAMFYAGHVRRRRSDVLNKARHLNRLPSKVPARARAPTFAPLPPMAVLAPDDDVAATKLRFNGRRKPRAA